MVINFLNLIILFLETYQEEDCEKAYFKMDNVLIDDRRIHVDFSQSVAKVKWKGKGNKMYTLFLLISLKFLIDIIKSVFRVRGRHRNLFSVKLFVRYRFVDHQLAIYKGAYSVFQFCNYTDKNTKFA